MANRVVVSTLLLAAGLLWPMELQARQTYQLGGSMGHPWEEKGGLTNADVAAVPGAIRPLETQLSRNLVLSMDKRGGGMHSLTASTYTLPFDWIQGAGVALIDGDSTTAFVHPPRIDFFAGPGFFWGMPIFFDLGAPFTVERIRFITRPDFPENTLRQYSMFLNDGSDESKTKLGDLIWTLLRRETDNLDRVVVLDIEPQVVRHIHFLPGTRERPGDSRGGPGETFEIAEFEVYGQGFVPLASYLSA